MKLRTFTQAQEEMGTGPHTVDLDDTWGIWLWSPGQDSHPSHVLDICGGSWDPQPGLPPPALLLVLYPHLPRHCPQALPPMRDLWGPGWGSP